MSFICPTKYIEKYQSQGDFVLALAHLINLNEENQYEKEIKKLGLPIYLDNSLFENHEPEPVESLIKKALKIGAELFFAPDYLYNRKKTEKSIDITWKIMQKMRVIKKLKLGAVVQASNSKDYIASYKKFVADKRISLVGLSILSIPKSFLECTETRDITKNRIECIKQLNLLKTKKNSHLLGAGSGYQDVKYAKATNWVVSHDSSSAFWNGLHGKKINKTTLKIDGGKSKMPVNFNYSKPLTKQQVSNIEHNIAVVQDLCTEKQ